MTAVAESGVTPSAEERFFRYWGKAARVAEARAAKHLLVYHLLDVAAVGAVFLKRHSTLLARFASLMGMQDDAARKWILWLLAQHDIGKFAAAFQRLREDLAQDQIPPRFRYTTRHDTLGYQLWKEKLLDEFFPYLREEYDLEEALLRLLRTSSGHHGKPPEDVCWESCWFRDCDVRAAHDFAAASSRLFFGCAPPPEIRPDNVSEFQKRIAAASWPVAGLSVLCDWIGSNRRSFPFVETPMPLQCYWEEYARPRAEQAVHAAGVLPVPSSARCGFTDLFPTIEQPTHLQNAAANVSITDGPQLFVIEGLTGSGKTEAALTLAARLLASGSAEGLYVALPTTATADAMYSRVGSVYRRMFHRAPRPSLVLAHSRRDLSREFRQSIDASGIEPEAPYGDDERGAAATCAAWLADNRKKALLAQVGVGTIDQSLLAVLNVRHQSLRAFGLLGKVLIVDEVHACDAYMNRLLEHLLQLHAAQGGSAILLSATLPGRTRQRLVEAFAEGAGFEPPPSLPEEYPLLLGISGCGVDVRPVQPAPWARRTLGFKLVHDPPEALDWIIQRAKDGACVAWVRNTVNDAIEAYDRLRERLGEDSVVLFHARFALGDRLDIEQRVLSHFGKGSADATRRGQVVVATQVIEQSLDLDFDEMLSDLAPIDLLVQRAGRLRRHRRDRHGNLLPEGSGPDQRGDPVLRVLSPKPVADPAAGWIRDFLAGTAAVYPHHGQLWLTARYLADHPRLRLPEAARRAMEAVFGATGTAATPQALDRTVCQVEGQWRADASIAEGNAIQVFSGYGDDFSPWTDHEDTRTRLGEPTVRLRLALWDGERLRPLAEAGPHPWRLSEVALRRSMVCGIVLPEDPDRRSALVELQTQLGPPALGSLLVPLTQQAGGTLSCLVLNGNDRAVTLRYSHRRGLEVDR